MDDEAIMREAGVKEATQEIMRSVTEAYKLAAVVRASMNPEIVALAPYYEIIGATWARHAALIISKTPRTIQLPKPTRRRKAAS